jgi:hypothetical protein
MEYYLVVRHPGMTAGANDFYFLSHGRSGSNPVEANDVANNGLLNAEALEATPNSSGGQSYFVDGQILVAGGDEDNFKLAIPDGVDDTWRISVSCGAQRLGSGVRNLTVQVLDGTGASPGADYTGTEAEDKDLLLEDLAIPPGGMDNSVYVRISDEDVQGVTVTSRFYRCGFHFSPPAQQ